MSAINSQNNAVKNAKTKAKTKNEGRAPIGIIFTDSLDIANYERYLFMLKNSDYCAAEIYKTLCDFERYLNKHFGIKHFAAWKGAACSRELAPKTRAEAQLREFLFKRGLVPNKDGALLYDFKSEINAAKARAQAEFHAIFESESYKRWLNS